MASRPQHDWGGPSTSRPSTGSSGNQPSLSPSNSFGSFVSVRPRTNQPLRRRSQSATAPISIAKSEAQKDRVTMACTHCRSRKVRCDGGQPTCGLCGRLGRVCSYAKVTESENVALRARKRALRERRAKEADMNRGWAAEALQSPQLEGYPDVWPPGMAPAAAPHYHSHHAQHHHPGAGPSSTAGGFTSFAGPSHPVGLSSPSFEPISHDGPLTSPYSAPDPSHPDSPLSARRTGSSAPYARMSTGSRRSPPERAGWHLSQLGGDGRGDGSISHLKSSSLSASIRPSISAQMSTSTLPPGPSTFDDSVVIGPGKSGGGSSLHGLRPAFGPPGSGLSEIPPYAGSMSTNSASGSSTTPSAMAFAGSSAGGGGVAASFTGQGPASWQHQQPSGLALPEGFNIPTSSGPAWSTSTTAPHLPPNPPSESSSAEVRITPTLGPWRSRAQTYDQPHPPPFIGALEHAAITDSGAGSGSSARDGGSGFSRGAGMGFERGAGGGWAVNALPPPQLPDRITNMSSAMDHQQQQHQPQTPQQNPHQPPQPPQQLQQSPQQQHQSYGQHSSHHPRHGSGGNHSSGPGSGNSSSYAFPAGSQPPSMHHHQHHHHPSSQGHLQHHQHGSMGSAGGGSGSGFTPQHQSSSLSQLPSGHP